jgi:predicted metallo-beta-lactamase superfamily hydrolase
MFLREGAANWLSTLTEYTLRSYESFKRAFQDNFFKSRELLWKEAGDLLNQMQRPDERVDDFVTRLKRCARRFNITDGIFHHAVLHGLRVLSDSMCYSKESGIYNKL